MTELDEFGSPVGLPVDSRLAWNSAFIER